MTRELPSPESVNKAEEAIPDAAPSEKTTSPMHRFKTLGQRLAKVPRSEIKDSVHGGRAKPPV